MPTDELATVEPGTAPELEEALIDFFDRRSDEVARLNDTDDNVYYTLDLNAFNREHDELIPYILSHPRVAVAAAEEAIKRLLPPDTPASKWTVRLGNPETLSEKAIAVSKLRSEDLFHLTAVPGIVAQISDIAYKLALADYKCLRCGTHLSVYQGEYETPPIECYEEQGGCKRSSQATKFELQPEASRWMNAQRVEIQETPESTEGKMPQKMPLILYGNDLVGQLKGGNRLTVWGIPCVAEPRAKERRNTRERYLEVQGFTVLEQDASQLLVTSKDELALKALAADPDVYKKLTGSIAPFIIGYDHMKEALVLQLFGGVSKPHQRGDIHMLLVGDPSVAKTQLLLAITRIAPRGTYVTASQATHAGLTAYVEQANVFGAVRWVAEAGAMPLADGAGILAIDEFDKMHEEDRRRINPALDPQEFTVVKAGANMRMMSRVPVLAAANPKFARFDEHHYLPEQIDITPDTLSRFDCIWAILDRPGAEWDQNIIDSVFEENGQYEPEVDAPTFQKYIAYARRIAPVLTPEAGKLLGDWYKAARQKSWGEGAVAMTPRQLGALKRLSQASARVQLRAQVSIADAERAIRMMDTWMRILASENGIFDSDIFQTGISHSQREAIVTLRDIIAQLSGNEAGVADYEDIIQAAQQHGMTPDKVDNFLKRWAQEGEIYSPSHHKYRLVEKL